MTLLPTPRNVTVGAGFQSESQSRISYLTDIEIIHDQGYRLSVTDGGIAIASRTPAAAFYAEQTLKQLRRQYPDNLPYVEIEDWPDFSARGVMLDISRDKVPTMTTLFGLIDLLAEWKINQLQLYIEHTFAYSQHRTVWEHASPMTADEIRELDQYCRERFIDLVPNQNSFGHMERWLRHSEYAHLAEAIDGAETPWGFRWEGPFSLCPTDPKSLKLLEGLYAELLPNFTSRFFNVGCDETFDIGQGRSKTECDRIGTHHVYLNFLDQVNQRVKSHGKQMMFWGDVILHQPDLIAELPAGLIALEWGYEANHPFDKEGEAFKKAGIPYYVCPGTSSWNCIGGRTFNAIENLHSAAESGLRHGAIGYLNTDWGDNGHLQYLPISYLGFAAGAAFSWCMESNRHLATPTEPKSGPKSDPERAAPESTGPTRPGSVHPLVTALNFHVFKDLSGALGQVAFDLGNVYRVCGKPNSNGSALFRLLVPPPNDAHPETGMTEEGFKSAEDAIDAALALLHRSAYTDSELRLITDEFQNAAKLLLLCVAVGRARLSLPPGRAINPQEIIAEHRRLWLARNRPGGLDESLNKILPQLETLTP